MQGFNHIAGGYAFTGLFCSFADLNIFDSPITLAVVGVASLLPDVDHTKSLIGKSVFPLASWLSRHYGHRTVTHSIFFFTAVVCIAQVIDNLFHLHYTLPIALALASHLIFDMCTKQGIPLFYPFSRRPVVLPANPRMRLSANDYRSEAVIFVLFCCLNLFSMPLMASGFWTRYNRSFATFEHLAREAKRKPGDYQITYLNPDNDTITATVVQQKPTELLLYVQDQIMKVDPRQIRLVSFDRLSTRHELATVNLLAVSVDSLNTYLSQSVVNVTAQSTTDLYFFQGPIMQKGTNLNVDIPNGQKFQLLAIDNSATEAELKLLIARYNQDKAAFTAKLDELASMRKELAQEENRPTTNDFDEGERRQRVLVLTEKINTFVTPLPPSAEVYHVQRAMLEMKLKESASINASLLIWQAKEQTN